MNAPGVGGAAAIGLLVTDVGVLILVTKLEAQVVDNVAAVLDDISALCQVAGGSLAADVLESDDGVGVRGSREAGQDALLGEEQGAGADGEEGAPVKMDCQLSMESRVLQARLTHSRVGSFFWTSL